MSQLNQLTHIVESIKLDYVKKTDDWETSPFRWIRYEPSARKGVIGEKIIEKWLTYNNITVSKSPDLGSDRIIEGHRAEIKLSTLWETNVYKFQQFRDQNYSFAICLGLSPYNVHCWVIPKPDILRLWSLGMIRSQHNGSRGTETAWFSVNPDNVHQWLRPYGGTLDAAVSKIVELTK